jgi:hypothetical protein
MTAPLLSLWERAAKGWRKMKTRKRRLHHESSAPGRRPGRGGVVECEPAATLANASVDRRTQTGRLYEQERSVFPRLGQFSSWPLKRQG